MQKVYKHLWPSVREFWLSRVKKFSEKPYIIFEDERYSYGEVHQRALKVAGVFRHVYNVEKGDRIGICSRNCPDYLVSFWAAHLLGAVPVLINGWLPIEPLQYCLARTDCKVVMLDAERADRIAPVALEILRDRPTSFLVFGEDTDKNRWPGMGSFLTIVDKYQNDLADILATDLQILPEDNALIMFTSGTTGMPKGVLSTQRQFLTNIPNVMVGGIRASLRRGGDYPDLDANESPQKGALIGVPLFHVTGLTSFTMLSTAIGMKIVLTPKWIVEEAHYLSVPAMVSDLIESSLAGYALEGLLFGGSPAPDTLVPRAQHAFPTATM
ncbi:hypothetical protein DXG01_008922 [Tephrocybe rancida]|nr:hypothetical protein DXG01_008922 [Tephrocybe rancida]